MDKYLNRLFDYQRFENNLRISKMIDAAEKALSDDDLAFVNAAGTNDSSIIEEMKEKKRNGRINNKEL